MANALKKTLITALAATTIGSQFSNIAAAAEPMDEQKVWGEYSLLLDTSSIDERMQRFEQSKAYRDALSHQAGKDTDSGYTRNLASNDFYSRYAIFYAVASNPDVTVENALPFGGMKAIDPASTYLNHNLQYVVECRDSVNKDWQKSQQSLLRINAIRSCAKDKAQESYKLNIQHPELMQSSLDSKLENFDADKTAQNDYTKSVMKRVHEMQYNSPNNMPGEFHIRLWDAVFDEHTSWEQFKGLAIQQTSEKKTPAFQESGKGFDLHTDHMQSFLECRDDIVGNSPAISMLDRKQQFDDVMQCWDQAVEDKKIEAHAQKSSYLVDDKDAAYHIRHIDAFIGNIRAEKAQPAYLQKYWGPLIDTRKSFDAQYPTFGNAGLRGLVTAWDAMMTPSVTWKSIQNTKDRNNKPVFQFLDPTTKNMTANSKFLFECRDAFLPETLPEKYREKLEVFHEIGQCWAEKAAEPNLTFEAERTAVAERSQHVMQDMRSLGDKLADYNGWANDQNPIMKPYADAVIAKAAPQRKAGSFTGTNPQIMTQWHALLDTNVTFDDLKKTAGVQGKNQTVLSYTANMSFVLDCRDQVLGQEGITISVKTADNLQQQILSCAKPLINSQNASFKQDMQTLRSTENIANDASDHDIHLFTRIVGNPKLDQSIYDHDARMQKQDSSSLLFTDNLDIVFNCRAEAIQKTPDIEGAALVEQTKNCASEIIATNKAENKRTKKYLAIAFAGALGLGGLGFLGFRQFQARQRKTRMLSN